MLVNVAGKYWNLILEAVEWLDCIQVEHVHGWMPVLVGLVPAEISLALAVEIALKRVDQALSLEGEHYGAPSQSVLLSVVTTWCGEQDGKRFGRGGVPLLRYRCREERRRR